ncbi:hypothetical protein BX286_2917 [Streptomyces sp. 3211.6]|uniref:hypothetical protein n=1 Tax=Streptomyces sp. 3211.6 TaxID=1938845 RepID=UPI000C2BB5E8|nr:hypothetical protein [Streptomyces sp. 3211.6]RKT04940.1 hypothetical protein BX286_2917 [Streptomyces sp. 3211.6]
MKDADDRDDVDDANDTGGAGELVIRLSAAEAAELADLADASGSTPEEHALAAVREHLRRERERVGAAAERLARLHAPLLKRLGE